MIKIDIDTFCKHWIKDKKERGIVSRFEQNVFDFATVAGHYSKEFFAHSFTSGGFNKSGRPWQPRRDSKWMRKKKYTHPILLDTGKLKEGIKGKPIDKDITNRSGRTHAGKVIYKRGAKYDIETKEQGFPIKNKRGGKKKPRNYAVIHNNPKEHGLKLNQHSSETPAQRQFIGFSPVLDSEIASKFIHILFKGFPNA